ncbi:MAG: hypothetical protein ACRDRO_24400 [Pseudonocardiaceae bacterium]
MDYVVQPVTFTPDDLRATPDALYVHEVVTPSAETELLLRPA